MLSRAAAERLLAVERGLKCPQMLQRSADLRFVSLSDAQARVVFRYQ